MDKQIIVNQRLIFAIFISIVMVFAVIVWLNRTGRLAEMFSVEPYPSNPPASQPPASQPPASHGPINVCTGITPKTPAAQKGQTLTFTCAGTVEDQDHVADFRVKYRTYGGSTFSDVASKSKIANTGTTANAKFVYSYSVPDSAFNGDYLVECRICNPSETDCTDWGKAQ